MVVVDNLLQNYSEVDPHIFSLNLLKILSGGPGSSSCTVKCNF